MPTPTRSSVRWPRRVRPGRRARAARLPLLPLALALLAAPRAGDAQALAPTVTRRVPPGTLVAVRHGSVQVNGRVREFRVALPAGAMRDPLPVVFAFHGGRGGMDRMPLATGLDELAADGRAIVVYPDGEQARWSLRGRRNEDLAFFDTLLAAVAARYPVDRARVFVAGMSNGAYFAHLLAARRSTVVAAVAAHSGGLGVLARAGIAAPRKYPVLVVHGAEDRVVPLAEARRARDAYRREGHAVEYVEVPEWGHAWAAARGVNERIWAFFAGQALR